MINEVTTWAHNRPVGIGYNCKTTTFNPGSLVSRYKGTSGFKRALQGAGM